MAQRGGKQFTKFRELVKIVGISQEVEDAGNVTMFAPRNRDFDNVTSILEDVELPTIRQWMRKHFVKGFLYRKNMEFGAVPVRTFHTSSVFLAKFSFSLRYHVPSILKICGTLF